jgi:predicted Zn-ribbon and HTH transcriptional regulator
MAAPAALHLLHGWWIASCPDCGFELGRRRDQEAAERIGQRRRCPICRPNQATGEVA